MSKRYIISIDTKLQSFQQRILQKEIEALNVNVVSKLDPLGVMAVEVPDDKVVNQLRLIKGILAVEDDAPMSAL